MLSAKRHDDTRFPVFSALRLPPIAMCIYACVLHPPLTAVVGGHLGFSSHPSIHKATGNLGQVDDGAAIGASGRLDCSPYDFLFILAPRFSKKSEDANSIFNDRDTKEL